MMKKNTKEIKTLKRELNVNKYSNFYTKKSKLIEKEEEKQRRNQRIQMISETADSIKEKLDYIFVQTLKFIFIMKKYCEMWDGTDKKNNITYKNCSHLFKMFHNLLTFLFENRIWNPEEDLDQMKLKYIAIKTRIADLLEKTDVRFLIFKSLRIKSHSKHGEDKKKDIKVLTNIVSIFFNFALF